MHGVHLHEGLGSYLANGYLVAMNYAEVCSIVLSREVPKYLIRVEQITQISIARNLASLRVD